MKQAEAALDKLKEGRSAMAEGKHTPITTSTFDLWWPDQSFQPPKNYRELAAIAVCFANNEIATRHAELFKALEAITKAYKACYGGAEADPETLPVSIVEAEAALTAAREDKQDGSDRTGNAH